MGTVFQDNLLLPHLNAFDNVAFALRVTGVPQREWPQRVTAALRTVGLEHKKYALPLQLSLGEQQRVAIARAIVGNPPLLLADEPTGNLDPDNSREVLKVLQNVNLRGTTVIVATHAKDLVETFRHRTLTLRKGKLVRDDPYGGTRCETDSVCSVHNPAKHRVANSTSGIRSAPPRFRSD